LAGLPGLATQALVTTTHGQQGGGGRQHTIDAGHGFMKGPGLWECSGHVLVMPLPLWKLKPITDGASRLMGNACPMDPFSTDGRSIVDSGKGDNGR